MSRAKIDGFEMDKTTIVTRKTLLDRVSKHLVETGETQTSFVTRALVNQLENEGDLTIREELEEESDE